MADAQLSPDDTVRAVLLESHDEFRQLVSEHHRLDERIRQLSHFGLSHRSAAIRRNLTQETETSPEGSHRDRSSVSTTRRRRRLRGPNSQ